MIRDETFEIAAADVHALEQPLRDLHRPLGREAELAVGFLLQRRGRERRRRPLRERLLFDAGDRPRQVARERLHQRVRLRLVEHANALAGQLALRVEVLAGGDALVADADERGGELAIVGANLRLEVPVARRAERHALFFALDDQADGDALHAAGAEAGLHLLPQHRRQRVAVEPIENAAALLRAHQVLVDVLVRLAQRLP